MSAIQSIVAMTWTADRKDAGTDGDVYLGIGGREFYIDLWDVDDNERGRAYSAVIGPAATISQPAMNDTRYPYQLYTERLDDFPVYLRFRGDNHWCLSAALVLVYGGTSWSDLHFSRGYSTPYPADLDKGLWLGPGAGECIHLKLSYLWEFDRKMMATAKLPSRLRKLLPKQQGSTPAKQTRPVGSTRRK